MSKQSEIDYADQVNLSGLLARPYSKSRLFHEFAMVLRLLRKHLPRCARMLDLGCGSGWTSWFLANAGYRVVGLDISERMIAIARRPRHQLKQAPYFVVQDVEELALPKGEYDGALFFDALHHCPGYERALERVHQHLRDGGHLVIFEPSWLHRYSRHAKGTTQTYGVTELGFTRRQLGRALRRAGFRKVWNYYDPGTVYRGFFGLLSAQFRLWCGYLCGFPRLKQIIVARK